MKKVFLLLSLILCLSMSGFSAKFFKWGAGISCNVNTTKFLSSQYKALNPISMDFGFNCRFSLKLFYAQTGLYYQLKKGDIQDQILNTKAILETDYLQIPVTVGLKFNVLKSIIAIRPFVSLSYATLVYVSKNNFNINRTLMNPNIGYWQAGVGMDVWFISLDLSYRRSFNSVLKNENYKSSTFNIGLYFNL